MARGYGLVGNAVRAAGGAAGAAAGQALALVWIAKTSTDETLGLYALALAVAGPAFLFARMQMRYLLASQPEADFGTLLRARLTAVACCTLLLAAVAAAWLPSAAAWTVALLATARAVEDVADLLHGLRQRSGQWNRIAGSQILRGLGGATALAAGMSLTGELAAGLLAALLWQIAVTVAVDARGLPWPTGSWTQAAACLRSCWPLGAAGALVSVNGYLPRYALELSVGSEAVGHLAALAHLALLGNLPVQALSVASLGELGRRAQIGRGPFLRMVSGLAAAALLIGLLGLAATVWMGERVLLLLYTPGIAELAPLLPWVMGGAVFMFVTAVFGYGLVALGEKRSQMAVFALSALAGAAACAALVPEWGLWGAVSANLVCWSSAAFLSGGALWLRAAELAEESVDCPARGTSSKLNACPAPVGSSFPSAS